MRRFAAQYVFTNNGYPLKRGIVSVNDEGVVTDVKDTGGDLSEEESVEFHNGIIIPGFVNCHSHLELSHLKGVIPEYTGLSEFLKVIRTKRDTREEDIRSSAEEADSEMYNLGTALCADICNTSFTFEIKSRSRIKYINLFEVFGIDPGKASKRLREIKSLSQAASAAGLSGFIVPHSAYSLSLTLLRYLRSETGSNKITSVHFMETEAEKEFLLFNKGPIMNSYSDSGLLTGIPETVKDHASMVLEEITTSGNLILVHNTYSDSLTIDAVNQRGNLYWCLCPNSNLYIENNLPPVRLLVEKDCRIVIGTDSYASNKGNGIFEEIKTLQLSFPWLTLESLVKWATIDGAKALCETASFGSIEEGKRPGLILIKDLNLHEMKLTHESRIVRLV